MKLAFANLNVLMRLPRRSRFMSLTYTVNHSVVPYLHSLPVPPTGRAADPHCPSAEPIVKWLAVFLLKILLCPIDGGTRLHHPSMSHKCCKRTTEISIHNKLIPQQCQFFCSLCHSIWVFYQCTSVPRINSAFGSPSSSGSSFSGSAECSPSLRYSLVRLTSPDIS